MSAEQHLAAFGRLSDLTADPDQVRYIIEQTATGFIVFLVQDKTVIVQSDDIFFLPEAIEEACNQYEQRPVAFAHSQCP